MLCWPLLFKIYAWPKFHGSSPYTFWANDLNAKTRQKFTLLTTTLSLEKQYICLTSASQARQKLNADTLFTLKCFTVEAPSVHLVVCLPLHLVCSYSGKEGVCNHMYIYWRFRYKVIKSKVRITSKLCILILFPYKYSQPKKLTSYWLKLNWLIAVSFILGIVYKE